MKYENYANYVNSTYGSDYVLKVGDYAITTKEVSCLARKFKKGTRVKIIDVSGKGYDLMDEHGNRIIETGWDCVRKEVK